MSDSEIQHDGLIAAGGWCAPSDTTYHALAVQPTDDVPEVAIRRGGMSYTAAAPVDPPTPEERAAWAEQQRRAREERKAAGGEWRYALREPDGEIHDGSNPWDRGTVYNTAEEAIEGEAFLVSGPYEVIRRWVTDPPEWAPAPTEEQS